MNAITTESNASTIEQAPKSFSHWRVYKTETRLECFRVLRMPSFALPTLLFPAIFYLLFGILMGGGNRQQIATYLLSTYAIFGVMGPGLFGFGASVAMERDRGGLTWRRAVPSLTSAYFFAKIMLALLFAVIIFVELAFIARFAGDVQLNATQWLQLFSTSVFSALPFCALGLVIGTRIPGASAPAIINLIYLPMAYLSGLWLPIQMLPDFIKNIAAIWPSYHAAQIALHVIGQDMGTPVLHHITYLIAFSVIMLWIATIFWSRMKLK